VFSLFTVGLSSGLLQNVEAFDSKHPDAQTQCRSGQVLVYHINFRKFICTSESGAAQWIRNGIAEVVGEPTPSGGEQLDKSAFAKQSTEAIRKQEIADIYAKLANGERISKSEERMVKRATQFIESGAVADNFYKSDSASIVPTQDPTQPTGSAKNLVASSTLTSSDDPANADHELAIVLPLSDKTYIGRLTFSASEPVQYVTLIGPLGPGENVGQQTWSPDNGETNYALVKVDNGLKSGGWAFAGNALALSTTNSEPFTVTYSVAYVELAPGVYDRGTVGTGTIQSGPDPGIGHESHSLAMILPPRDIPYQGGFFCI
jgi:hypothetical protein